MPIRHLVLIAVYFAFSAYAYAQTQASLQQPQPATFEQKLREVRYDLQMMNDRFAGTAAPVLESAIAGAQYVLIGEDHITREVPQFTTAVCDMMGPQGFSTMVVEASPEVAVFMSGSLGKPDRVARMAALLHQYPDSVAFFNIRQENDLVEHCAQAAHNPNFHLWGLDQPFIGSAGWLLEQMLATHPGPKATAVLNRLKGEEQKDAAQAQETGDPSKVFLLAAPESELTDAAVVLQREGNLAANMLLQELIESRRIYLENFQGHAAESNDHRAHLLKQNFRQHQKTAGDDQQKMLVKFGDSHLYKGFNDIHQRDLGNYIAEVADAQGARSLHICVLGANGSHWVYGGYNRPGKLEPFSLGEGDLYPWVKPAVDSRLPNEWTLYDLRKLRFQPLGSVDPQMERLIYGYDLLVIAPKITPADPIQ